MSELSELSELNELNKSEIIENKKEEMLLSEIKKRKKNIINIKNRRYCQQIERNIKKKY